MRISSYECTLEVWRALVKVRFSRVLQTSRVHPLLDTRTLIMNQFLNILVRLFIFHLFFGVVKWRVYKMKHGRVLAQSKTVDWVPLFFFRRLSKMGWKNTKQISFFHQCKIQWIKFKLSNDGNIYLFIYLFSYSVTTQCWGFLAGWSAARIYLRYINGFSSYLGHLLSCEYEQLNGCQH